MQVTTNTKLIQRRRRLGTYASFGGLAVLIVGMVISLLRNQPNLIWVSLVAVIVGFLLAQYGNYNLRRWGRTPRPDQVLETALKGFDDRYHLYAWSTPAPYVLLSPQGIYSFATRDQSGQITVKGTQWGHKRSLARRLLLFADEGLGNPASEALEMAERLKNWITSRLPDVPATVQPVVVFIDERAELQVNEPLVPVMDAKSLKKWLRGAGKGTALKSTDLKALEDLLNTAAESLARR